ncbi:MAG: class I SAM-dependent methyltransferase [Acidimicrobiia bacterium]
MGPLFGMVVARALDRWWSAIDEPDPFVVIEAGAGNGRLAREVLRAGPVCAPALRYLLVERSDALRAEQREHLLIEPLEDVLGPATPTEQEEGARPVTGVGPIVGSIDELPAVTIDGVVLANELLDNLPFEIVERGRDGWLEVRVGAEGDRFCEVLVDAPEGLVAEADALVEGLAVPVGVRLPIQRAAQAWITGVAARLHRGFVAVMDYGADAAAFVGERRAGWLRTYRAHARGSGPLDDPGSQDITADVVLEPVRAAATRAGLVAAWEGTQAGWLHDHGIDDLVEEGRRTWERHAAVGDLDALAARSRVSEAAALTDPAGLGAHRVLVFRTRDTLLR